MPTISLMATQSYSYAARSVSKGDIFDASESDARLLKLIGRAVDAPVVIPVRVIQTRDLEPESDPDPVEPKPKRQYRRRDLTAEP